MKTYRGDWDVLGGIGSHSVAYGLGSAGGNGADGPVLKVFRSDLQSPIRANWPHALPLT